MSNPLTSSDVDGLRTSINNLTTAVNRGGSGGLILPTPATVISGTTDALIKLTSGTYGLTDALDLGKKAAAIFPAFGGVVGETFEKVGKAGLAYNDVLKDLSKSGFNFNLDIGNMVSAVAGARLSLPQFQALVKETGVSLTGLSGDANRSSAAFLGLAKDVAESKIGRELVATGISFEELQKSLAITTAMRRGTDLRSDESQKEVIRSATEMAREMDNIARLTGINRQEQEKAMAQQMKKAENEIMLLAMSDKEREAYQASMTSLGGYPKQFQDVLTAFKTGGIRTAEDTMKVAQLGPEFTRLVKELSEIEGNDAEANRRRQAIMSQIDAENLRIMSDRKELETRAQLATAGGDFGRGMADVTVGLKAMGTVLLNLERDRKPGESVEQARARLIQEYDAQRKAAADGTGAAGQQTAALINRTEALFKDISAGVGVAFKEGNTAVGGFAKELRTTINEVIVPLNQGYMTGLGRNIVDKIKGGALGRGENLSNDVVTNPAISGRPEAQARNQTPGREALGSKSVFGDWFNGPLNRLTYLAEDEKEASVPWSKRSQFIADIAKNDPSVLAPLMKEMQSTLASASTSSMNNTKDIINEIVRTLPTTISDANSALPTAPSTSGFTSMASDSTDIQIEMVKGIQSLNKLTAQLIDAVESTGEKNARAIKSRGNLIA